MRSTKANRSIDHKKKGSLSKSKSKDEFLVDDIDSDNVEDSDNELSLLATGIRGKKDQEGGRRKKGDESGSEEDDDLAEESEIEETADEKRIRLAKEYLASVGASVEDDEEDEMDDEEKERRRREEASGVYGDDASYSFGDDKLGKMLRRHALRSQGKEDVVMLAHKFTQLNLLPPSATKTPTPTAVPAISDRVQFRRGPRLTATCVAATEEGSTAYCGSKDSSIWKWDVETGKRTLFNLGSRNNGDDNNGTHRHGHKGDILCMSLSSDGVYLATGGKDKTVRIWDTRSNEMVKKFHEHRDVVTGVCFRKDALDLYSCSLDRCVCTYNIQDMHYIETLYGHQAPVQGVTALYQEKAFTCASDYTVRVWKIDTETQLMLKTDSKVASLDCITALSPLQYVTGAQDGSLALWSSSKKKPLDICKQAHNGEWISSVGSAPASDVLLSGSNDGYLRIWSTAQNRFKPVGAIPVNGYVNGIQVMERARMAFLAIGSEHRLGRWKPVQGAKNGLMVVKLLGDLADEDEDNDDDHDDKEVEEKGERKDTVGMGMSNKDFTRVYEDDEEEDDEGGALKKSVYNAGDKRKAIAIGGNDDARSRSSKIMKKSEGSKIIGNGNSKGKKGGGSKLKDSFLIADD